MDIHYDPKVWDSDNIEFNVGLNHGIDNIDYTCHRRAKSSMASDTNSDRTAVSWLSGLFSPLSSKLSSSSSSSRSTAVAHGFLDEDENEERRFSFRSQIHIVHAMDDIPPLSQCNPVHLSTPSLRYTKQFCPEPTNVPIPQSTIKKRLPIYKLKHLPSPLIRKLRAKFKSQSSKKRRMRSFSTSRLDEHKVGPDDDIVLYPDEPDPDPFARQFGPYRVVLD